MKELWVEKYRPKTIDQYVFRDEHQRNQVMTWIKEKSFPHIILSGSAGIGKTTLAKILINEVGVEEYDVKIINASRFNGVDDIRDEIISFIEIMPWGPFKVVLLDEADYLSPNAQAILRGVMEEYHSVCRFILTCNYPHKIIPALHSRCQGFHVEKTDQTEFTARVATVLVEENVDFDLDTLDVYVKLTYPDLRKAINLVQQNVHDNKLAQPNTSDTGTSEWRIDMIRLFKEKKLRQARELICAKAQNEEMESIYRWMYDNLDLITDDEEKKDSALLIIKQGLVDHAMIADGEINMSATMTKLIRLQ